AIAAVGGKLVPFGGLDVVARHPETVAVNLAQKRHRLEVAFLVDAVGRERQGGEIMAALEGPEGQIGLAPGGCRRRRGWRRARRRGFCCCRVWGWARGPAPRALG